MTPDTLPVSEVYGPVPQGEGKHIGLPVWFLRLGLCNLSCEWCDTPFTWDTTRFDVQAECPPLTTKQIRHTLPRDVTLVLSGGEPLIHQRNTTLQELVVEQSQVHVETNGTIIPTDQMIDSVQWWSVSPKLANAGMSESKRLKPRALQVFTDLATEGRAGFKFVASHPNDLTEIAELVDRFDIPVSAVWVMPEGATFDRHISSLRLIHEQVTTCGWNLAPRLHVLIHDAKRGV